MDRKNVLSEFVYKLNEKERFLIQKPFWSVPFVGFSFDNSLPSKYLDRLEKENSISEGIGTIICILGEWEEVTDGIVFTDRAMYLSSPKNSQKKFKIRYNEITSLKYEPYIPESCIEPKLSIEVEGKSYIRVVDVAMWSKRCIHDFLQFACGQFQFREEKEAELLSIQLDQTLQVDVGSIVAGIVYGNVSNASSIYFDDKIVSPRGHGFAAEHANHLYDLFRGKNAKIVGDDNALNGADRIVDGVQIQSKYCRSGSACVQECFQDGKFRYWNADGTPMKIEVPSDMYDAAVQAMKSRIERGEVPGVTDPNEAANIIKKGQFTYAQARNIAKAGTIESITYDAASGAVIAANAFGITAILTFAGAIWSGADLDIALESAALQGLKVGGTTFIASVLAGQLSKAGMNSAMVGGTEALAKLIGPKASAFVVNALRDSATNIYGSAAIKSFAKIVRCNTITALASFAVLSVGDVCDIFSGRISSGQLAKNLTTTATSVTGGTAGWMAGAAAGSAVLPGLGTVLGGILGALGGGSVISSLTRLIMDEFIEDDANEMISIIQEVFAQLAEEYIITQEEGEKIAKLLQNKLSKDILKDMYASGQRRKFARNIMEDFFKDALFERAYITLPTLTEMQEGLRLALEDIADNSTQALSQAE